MKTNEERCGKCGKRNERFVNNYFESHMMAYGHHFEATTESPFKEKVVGPYRYKIINANESNTEGEEILVGPNAENCDDINADGDYLLNFGFAEGLSASAKEVAKARDDYFTLFNNTEKAIESQNKHIGKLEAELSALRGNAVDKGKLVEWLTDQWNLPPDERDVHDAHALRQMIQSGRFDLK